MRVRVRVRARVKDGDEGLALCWRHRVVARQHRLEHLVRVRVRGRARLGKG